MARNHQIRLAWLAMGAMVALVGACSVVAEVDREKITQEGRGPAQDSGEGGTGGTVGTGGSSGTAGTAGIGGTAGTAGIGGTAGTAGSGGGAICSSPKDCPAEDTTCQTPTCINGTCGLDYEIAGKLIATQNEGDCKKVVCNGYGSETTEADDSDVPTVDTECAAAVCNSGTLSIEYVDEGVFCSSGDGTVCDGGGVCVECVAPNHCTEGNQTCVANICVDGSCTNGKRDKGESDVDCGGTGCIPCEDGKKCEKSSDCQSQVCDDTEKTCAPVACDDSVQNGDEAGVDCGGSACLLCDGDDCSDNSDCKSGTCDTNDTETCI